MRRTIATRAIEFVMLVAVGVLGVSPTAWAGAPPNLLDANLGFVLPTPRIHNLFWDANWNADNAFSTNFINNFTAGVINGGYLNGLGQYGIGAATFAGSTVANSACGATRAPNSLGTANLVGWVLCEVTNPFSGAPFPSPSLPVSDDLYVLYLPQNTTISDNFTIPAFSVLGHTFGPIVLVNLTSCAQYSAQHIIMPTVLGLIQLAIVPTRCAALNNNATTMTRAASHEIVEASVDAVPGGGRIDDSFPLTGPSSPLTLNSSRFAAGEAGDLCESGGALPLIEPSLPAQPHFATVAGFTVSTYWSNNQNKCVAPTTVGKFRLRPPAASTRPGSILLLRVTWIAPRSWRELKTVELEVLDGRRVVGLIRFISDGSKHGQLALGRQTGRPGDAHILRLGPLSLDLAHSSVTGSGPKGKTVAINLALRFGQALSAHTLTLDLGATDRQGSREPFRTAGSVHVR